MPFLDKFFLIFTFTNTNCFDIHWRRKRWKNQLYVFM